MYSPCNVSPCNVDIQHDASRCHVHASTVFNRFVSMSYMNTCTHQCAHFIQHVCVVSTLLCCILYPSKLHKLLSVHGVDDSSSPIPKQYHNRDVNVSIIMSLHINCFVITTDLLNYAVYTHVHTIGYCRACIGINCV